MAQQKSRANFRKALGTLWRRVLRLSATGVVLAAIIPFAPIPAHARITRIQITSRGPAFGGFSFPRVGPYERIIGKGFGEISPADRHNNMIVDINLAPRNAAGNVEYSFDFYILKPVDLSKGNHKVFYEAPNRGAKLFADFNRSSGGNDPAASSDPSDTFLAPQGYTMVWSGWDAAAGADNSDLTLTITLPIAKNPDGSAITGPAYEYIVSPGRAGAYPLTYPAATLDRNAVTMTHRVHLDDAPQTIPAAGWEYIDNGTAIRLLPAGTNFAANDICTNFPTPRRDPTAQSVELALPPCAGFQFVSMRYGEGGSTGLERAIRWPET